MKKNILVFGLFVLVYTCHAEIIQIDFSGTKTKLYRYGGALISTPAWTNEVARNFVGTLTYNTDLFEESFTQTGEYWRWQYQSQQQIQLSLSFLDSGSSIPKVIYDNVLDYPFGTLTSYTEFKKTWGYLVNGQKIEFEVLSDTFELICDNKSEHTGLVDSLTIKFGGDNLYWEGEPIPYEPLNVFDPTHFKALAMAKYGRVKLETTCYSETGEYEGFYAMDFDITSCQVTVIPEPSTLLFLAAGIIIRYRRWTISKV